MTNNVMDTTIDKSSVKLWTEQALSTLQQAQKLCTTAQSSLERTSYQLGTVLPDKLNFTTFMIESLKKQQGLISRMVESIKTKIHDRTISSFHRQFERLLKPAINDLDNIVSQLQSTGVPSYVIDSSSVEGRSAGDVSGYKTLQDFISMDAIKLLKTNINIYKMNCVKLHGLLERVLQESILKPYQNSVKKYNRIIKQYDEIIPVQLDLKLAPNMSPFESNNIINTILKENLSLENELVSILEMLTNHYDQCVHGFQLHKSGNSDNVNLEVLRNDALELPEVLKELHAVYDIILNNETRAQKFLSTKVPYIDSTISMIKELLELYRTFKTRNISRYIILLSSCEDIFSKCPISEASYTTQNPIEVFTETVNQLAYHYTQFFNVYKSKYLVELHHEQYEYPRNFLAKLTDFLNDDLYKLQKEEKERRKLWLSKYGDFIPKEFKLPGEYNEPVVVQVVTEGLEEVQKGFHDGDFSETSEEKELIELITKMRDLKSNRS